MCREHLKSLLGTFSEMTAREAAVPEKFPLPLQARMFLQPFSLNANCSPCVLRCRYPSLRCRSVISHHASSMCWSKPPLTEWEEIAREQTHQSKRPLVKCCSSRPLSRRFGNNRTVAGVGLGWVLARACFKDWSLRCV